MSKNLGSFTDLPNALNFNPPQTPTINSAELLQLFGQLPKFPTDFQIQRGQTFQHDGINIEEISWSTGYGPQELKPIY